MADLLLCSSDVAQVAALGPFDYVLGSDIVWVDELVDPLAAALSSLVTAGTTALLAQERRSDPILHRFWTVCHSMNVSSTWLM